MRLNKTNLKRILGSLPFNIDNGYIISNLFIIKITNIEAEKLILSNFDLDVNYTYEKVKKYLIPKNKEFYEMKKEYSGEYNDYSEIQIKFSNFKYEINITYKYVELINMLTGNIMDVFKFNIEDIHCLYIEDYGLIMGLRKT